MGVLAPCINLEEDVIREDTEYASKDIVPTTLFSKEDVIDDILPQEIIVDTLHHEMMVMSGSQPMTHVLCLVVSYPPIEGNDKFKLRDMSSTIDVLHQLIEYITHDVSYSDEDIDEMEEFLID